MDSRLTQIRNAVQRGDFEGARVLWDGLREHPPTASEWPALRELYAWSRNFLLAERAQLGAQLNTAHVAGAYASTVPAGRAFIIRDRF